MANTQPKLHPALLRLSAIISQYVIGLPFNDSDFAKLVHCRKFHLEMPRQAITGGVLLR
jgi:hypothetical protein